MNRSSNFAALLAVIGGAALTLTAVPSFAQFNSGSFIGSVTSGIVTGAISEAISQNITEILHARPVVDMDKVSKVNGVAVSVEADRMVTALDDGSIRLWSLSEGRELAKLDGHSGRTMGVAVSQGSGKMASLGEDGSVQIWRLDSGKKIARYADGPRAGSVALSKSGALFATGHQDGSVRIRDAASGKVQAALNTDGAPVRAIALGGGDALLVAGTENGKLFAWNLKTKQPLFSADAHDGGIATLAITGDGSRVVSGGKDGKIRVSDMATGDAATVIDAGGGAVQSVSLSSNSALVAAAGADGVLRVFDLATGSLAETYEGHGATITSVAFGKDDKVIHSASLDGTTRVFERKSGAELAQAVSTPDGWAVYNMEGEFDGAGDGLEAVAWTAKENKFDLDQFSESHYEPGLLSRASEGEKEKPEAKRPNLSVEFATPPIVAFWAPDEDVKSDSEDYKMTVQAGDLGGGIIEMRLYQNGRLVRTKDLSGNDDKEISEDFEVKLLNGENHFRLVALSRDRIESRPAKVTVTYTGEELKSNLHVVTIGINEYRNPALNLNYGVPDAEGIRKFYEGQPRKLFKEIKFYTLENRNATRANIKKLLTSLTNTAPDDVVIIYYAGHGETVDNDWYLIPTDLVYPEREDEIRAKGIKSEELQSWVNNIKANKVVMLMDACKSGAALKAFRGFSERKALSRLARSSGVYIVAAAAKDQFATELKQLGHGAFTYALLDGLRGGADYAKDDIINIRELTTYIGNRLPDLSEEVSGRPQFPVINSRGGDFPIAVK